MMKFVEITETMKATPGEYIYHEPTRQIVMCGSFSRTQNHIRVLGRRQMFKDTIENFKKIELSPEEKAQRSMCKGCGA
jgi:hypothetical protein